MECQKKLLKIFKSGSLFAPTFINHYILPNLNCNVHCLANNNISILKRKKEIKKKYKMFSVDYNPIDTNNILDIHRYLMKEA